MTTIEKARAARAEQALEKLVKYDGKITTKKKFIEHLISNGYKPEESEKNKVQFDRRKFNRMNYFEQEDYEKKCNEKIKCFLMKNNEGYYHEISKAEFDFALTIISHV
jgi:hypothetical protein